MFSRLRAMLGISRGRANISGPRQTQGHGRRDRSIFRSSNSAAIPSGSNIQSGVMQPSTSIIQQSTPSNPPQQPRLPSQANSHSGAVGGARPKQRTAVSQQPITSPQDATGSTDSSPLPSTSSSDLPATSGAAASPQPVSILKPSRTFPENLPEPTKQEIKAGKETKIFFKEEVSVFRYQGAPEEQASGRSVIPAGASVRLSELIPKAQKVKNVTEYSLYFRDPYELKDLIEAISACLKGGTTPRIEKVIVSGDDVEEGGDSKDGGVFLKPQPDTVGLTIFVQRGLIVAVEDLDGDIVERAVNKKTHS